MKILSGTIARYWMRILLAIVALVVVLAPIWMWGGESDVHKKIDLTLKTLGGLLAAGAISNAFRRTRSAEKGQYSDRFAKAVEQIASEKLAIRLGGLASIEALSKETEDEFIRVWTYLGEFLRYPPELVPPWPNESKAGEIKEEQKEPLGQRPDIATVAAMLRNLDKTHLRWVVGKRFSLEYANLQGADLSYANLQDVWLNHAKLQGARLLNANLQGARLNHAKLQGARLNHSKLQGARLLNANLQGARLIDAELQGAELSYANLQDARLNRANLQGADLSYDANLQDSRLNRANLQGARLNHSNLQGARLNHTNLQGADLYGTSLRERELQQLFSNGNSSLLKGALFSLDTLTEALRIKVSMPEKMSEVYYDTADGPLPDDWPADYKPRPISYEEWLDKRKELLNSSN